MNRPWLRVAVRTSPPSVHANSIAPAHCTVDRDLQRVHVLLPALQSLHSRYPRSVASWGRPRTLLAGTRVECFSSPTA